MLQEMGGVNTHVSPGFPLPHPRPGCSGPAPAIGLRAPIFNTITDFLTLFGQCWKALSHFSSTTDLHTPFLPPGRGSMWLEYRAFWGHNQVPGMPCLTTPSVREVPPLQAQADFGA